MPKAIITASALKGIGGVYRDVLIGAGFELIYPPQPGQLTEDELLAQLKGMSASLAGSEPYTRRVIEANPSLRVIARVGVGYDAVDVAAATDRGVAVTIQPGTNQDAVAEHTFALILAIAKGLPAQHNSLKAGNWPRQTNLPLRGQTLGIAGLGRIGKAVALRGECFGMPLLAYEPYPDKEFATKHGITLVNLDQLLAESDYLSLHMPLTPESRELINRQTLARMKPTAFLINTARGGLVNEADLADALRNRRIAGAGIDVFQLEPPGKDNVLLGLENIVLTPHAAGVDLQSRDDMAASGARSIVALSRGQWPAEQIVNPDIRAKFRW
ncbi:MAG TPA: phosphoglycerate dehydrogenase [Gemmataceae bacterium]|nr:phosphoglycerate dehydrogenase [Gemmataceae bacterium]